VKIFISYSYKDSEIADLIKNQLLRQNIEVIHIDPDPKIGDNIAFNIEKAIRESDAYLILLSRNYSESKWSDLELIMIYDQSFGQKKGKRIFPLLLEKSASIPSLLKDLVYADFTEKSNRKIEDFVLDLRNQLYSEETTDYKKLRHLLKEREELLKIQEIEYLLQKDKQQRISKLFRWSFLMISVTAAATTILLFAKDLDITDKLDISINLQNVIFYLFGFLTAIIPSLYLSFKLKNKRNGK
jgi:hypothetical protein